MISYVKASALAVLIGLSSAGMADAGSFVTVQVLGSTTQNGSYTSSLSAKSGTTVYYEVIGEIATGTPTNNNKKYTLAQPQTSTDGINSIGFDLNNGDSSAKISSAALAPGWNGGNGNSPGTITGRSVTAVFAAQSPGVVAGGTSFVTIFTGALVTGSAASDAFSAVFDGSAGIDVNATKISSGVTTDGTPFSPSGTTETGADPYINFAPLTIAATPEPTSCGMLFLSASALFLRRRPKH